MKRKLAVLLMTALTASALLSGCGNQADGAGSTADGAGSTTDSAADAETGNAADSAEDTTEASGTEDAADTADVQADDASGEKVVLKAVCDLTPHSEILNAASDLLAAEGIELDIVSTTWDATWNDMLIDGEIDFAYFMHVPAMESIEEEMGATLYSMGGIHVEPYACFSDKYATKEELPENAVIAIPNDSSNEYRALKVLEAEGFIKLEPAMTAIDASMQEGEE